jgi:hypothetical protein
MSRCIIAWALVPVLAVIAFPALALPPQVPDPHLTPGAVLTTDRGRICTPGYSKTVRNVPESEKRHVYAEYGIGSHRAGANVAVSSDWMMTGCWLTRFHRYVDLFIFWLHEQH